MSAVRLVPLIVAVLFFAGLMARPRRRRSLESQIDPPDVLRERHRVWVVGDRDELGVVTPRPPDTEREAG